MELLPLLFTQWFSQELVFAIVRSYLRTINDDDLATNLLSKHKKEAFIMLIPKNVNTFALNLNTITMDDLNRLKVVLVEQKKTGKWLAEQLGVSVTTTSRWCSNASQPDLQTLNKIAKLLHVNMKDLLAD